MLDETVFIERKNWAMLQRWVILVLKEENESRLQHHHAVAVQDFLQTGYNVAQRNNKHCAGNDEKLGKRSCLTIKTLGFLHTESQPIPTRNQKKLPNMQSVE